VNNIKSTSRQVFFRQQRQQKFTFKLPDFALTTVRLHCPESPIARVCRCFRSQLTTMNAVATFDFDMSTFTNPSPLQPHHRISTMERRQSKGLFSSLRHSLSKNKQSTSNTTPQPSQQPAKYAAQPTRRPGKPSNLHTIMNDI
jgi:hypothetical protein